MHPTREANFGMDAGVTARGGKTNQGRGQWDVIVE
tara:strand:+ start:630 stop:734 length:105 start_codon:yes stop_codon:yes gene_type:complete